MTLVEKAVVAKLKREGKEFEILVDCDKAVDFKKGLIKSISEVLVVEQIFKNTKTGEIASKKDLTDVFKTDDVLAIAQIIVTKGELPLTTAFKKKETEVKEKQIIDKIVSQGIDPRTNLPVPRTRVENAFKQANIKVDANKSVDEQVNDIVKKLVSILPLKFEKVKIQILIPAKYTGSLHSYIKSICQPETEKWTENGSYFCVLSVTPGQAAEIVDKIEKETHGIAETEYIE